MENSTATIIKGTQATIQGRCQLQIGCNPMQNNVSDSKVRVAENQSDYIVLEITCSCGKKTYVKCQYTNP